MQRLVWHDRGNRMMIFSAWTLNPAKPLIMMALLVIRLLLLM
jgi:hypothetical protein